MALPLLDSPSRAATARTRLSAATVVEGSTSPRSVKHAVERFLGCGVPEAGFIRPR